MKHCWAFFLAVFLIACCRNTPPPPEYTVTLVFPVYVDSRFTNHEQSEIQRSLSDWNTALNGYGRFVVERTIDMKEEEYIVRDHIDRTGEGTILHKSVSDDPATIEAWDEGPEVPAGILGWTVGALADDIYLVTDRFGDRPFHVILEHELGHFLGAKHMAIPGSLMFPTTSQQGQCIDLLTLMQVASHLHPAGWDYHHMVACDMHAP